MAIARDSIDDKMEVNETDNESLDQASVDVDLEDPLVSSHDGDPSNVATRPAKPSMISTILSNLPFLITGMILLIIVLVVFQTLERQRAASQAEYVERASKLSALSQQITVDAGIATRGDESAFTGLQLARQQFATIAESLDKGDTGAKMAPLPGINRDALLSVLSLWEDVKINVDTILEHQDVLLDTHQQAKVVNETAPLLLTKADDMVDAVVNESQDVRLVNESARLRSLSQRIAKDVNIYAQGESNATVAAEQMGKDVEQFRANLEDLRRVAGPVTSVKLDEVDTTYNQLKTSVTNILEGSDDFFMAHKASSSIQDSTALMLPAVERLVEEVAASEAKDIRAYIPWVLGALIAVFLFLLGRALINDARNRADQSARQNRETQDAILKLLDEMGNLADGDLTIEAEVTDQITGAIADSVNFAVKEMRELVTRINTASQQVAQESQATALSAQELSKASARQADQITSTTETVQSMSRSMEDMSNEALRSAQVARTSVDVAKRGAKAVRETIQGMDDMRDQIQETSKRIKRLGESSQQISDIVGLINDIAEQTNILSLNAAIQAAMAGESGRGFAVVADEVQRLAERSAEATKQITSLVKNIQADTNEAVASMEQATQGMVDGTELADAAGQALGEIESVSEQISELIGRMAETAHKQSQSATDVSDQMTSIRDVTTTTSQDATRTAESIGKLKNLARELAQSVAGFKIPV
ncbi:MAG: methyl-accepting chemotaxis protein [Arenicellales bacterium]|nr:methyl-accepting chemotaxis protein [Arenicellales bacterium]